jgi:undecaprenol kinase/diacylglycerol kinase (ATP)
MRTKHSLASAFRYASDGCASFFVSERNGRIQLIVAICVIIVSLIAGLSHIEWCIILLCIGLVISLEMINSAIEKICDHIQPGYHILIKTIKDIAAAAVLWVSIISVIAGLLIFIPKFFL